MTKLGWPLSPHHESLVRELARIVALGGAWRLARGPVVAASTRDYPEPWDETRVALARVVGRTLWHAHMACDAVVDDVRVPRARGRRDYLRTTSVELVHADEAAVELAVSSIGNDDVAGIVAHEIGRAYVARLAGDHPYRSSDSGLPDVRIGSIATVALGLGVVAANAAHHDRSAGETIGRTAYHQHQIAHAGGLDWQDLTFLLAVQATVRDDVLSALDTLRPSQAESVAQWCEVLDDHEVELAAMLALGDVAAEPPPARDAVPRDVVVRGAMTEADLDRVNLGRPVFRYSEGRTGAFGFLGLLASLPPVLASAFLLGPSALYAVPMAIGTIVGGVYGSKRRLYRCATCRGIITLAATECRFCGGTVAGEIANPNQRLDAEERLELAQKVEGE